MAKILTNPMYKIVFVLEYRLIKLGRTNFLHDFDDIQQAHLPIGNRGNNANIRFVGREFKTHPYPQ